MTPRVIFIVMLGTLTAFSARSALGGGGSLSNVHYARVATPHGEIQFAYREDGAGRTVLLLHGLGTSSYTWRAVIPPLARNHRVIALDLRGFGASDKPRDAHYSIADQALAVTAFIERENLRDITIVGHSFGGGVTLALALKRNRDFADRIRNIVLIDTIAYRQPLPIFFRLMKIPLIAEFGMILIPPEVQATQALRLAYYSEDKITPGAVSEYSQPLYSSESRHALTQTVEQLIPTDIDDIGERYRGLRLPVQIIWCEGDRIVPVALGRRLHENVQTSELTVLSECGHLPQEEKPEETASVIRSFLSRHGG